MKIPFAHLTWQISTLELYARDVRLRLQNWIKQSPVEQIYEVVRKVLTRTKETHDFCPFFFIFQHILYSLLVSLYLKRMFIQFTISSDSELGNWRLNLMSMVCGAAIRSTAHGPVTSVEEQWGGTLSWQERLSWWITAEAYSDWIQTYPSTF